MIYHPIYEAGLYLARQGNEEYQACSAALRQYSSPFPSIWYLAKEIEGVYMDTKTTRAGSTLQGVGHLPTFLPTLAASSKGSHTNSTPLTAGSGPSTTEPVPIDNETTQAQTQVQNFDWTSQNMELLTVSHPPPQSFDWITTDQWQRHSQTTDVLNQHQASSTVPAPASANGSSNGTHRDFWPDGTPMPSRDIAWNLFDWTTLEADKP